MCRSRDYRYDLFANLSRRVPDSGVGGITAIETFSNDVLDRLTQSQRSGGATGTIQLRVPHQRQPAQQVRLQHRQRRGGQERGRQRRPARHAAGVAQRRGRQRHRELHLLG